jgi:hypothetical protein
MENVMGGAWSTHREIINARVILVEEPEGTRPLRLHRRIWEDIIKVDLK